MAFDGRFLPHHTKGGPMKTYGQIINQFGIRLDGMNQCQCGFAENLNKQNLEMHASNAK